jgi:inosine-uridine nucleoside N-ribohydrolase
VTDIVLHDALAVASLIDHDVITRKDYYVEVETAGEWTAGQTIGYDGHGPIRKSAQMETSAPEPPPAEIPFKANAQVAVGVDPDRFFRLLIGRLTGTAA